MTHNVKVTVRWDDRDGFYIQRASEEEILATLRSLQHCR